MSDFVSIDINNFYERLEKTVFIFYFILNKKMI